MVCCSSHARKSARDPPKNSHGNIWQAIAKRERYLPSRLFDTYDTYSRGKIQVQVLTSWKDSNGRGFHKNGVE